MSDLGVAMSPEVLEHKLEEAGDGRGPLATWITRRLPRLDEGWSNRLFVAAGGLWRGYFPLSGDILWTPEDAAAPYALIFDPRGWTRIPGAAVRRFRGWKYLESAPGEEPAGIPSRPAPSLSPGRTPSRSS